LSPFTWHKNYCGGIMLLTRLFLTGCLIMLAAILLLTGCAALAEIELPRPTAVPTLARLPSVTSVPPTATNLPATPTSTPLPPTPTSEPVMATVRVGANVRSGPGLSFDVVGTVQEGAEVTLLSVSNDWYQIRYSDTLSGWMLNEVLVVPEDAAPLIP